MYYNYSVYPRSLYIHWPFCPYKCHFCPFVAIAGQDHFMEQYHRALCAEMSTYNAQIAHRYALDTIYIGGGTPSTYPGHLLLDMFGTLRKTYDITRETEVTLEVNPGTVTHDKIMAWQQAGINRLSIGVQSLKESVLKNLNRHQTTAQVFDVVSMASHSFENISVDLIIGLPDVTVPEWKELVGTMVQLPIKHISIYFLTIHEGTPLYFRVKKQEVTLPCDDTIVDTYFWTINYLAEHGFMQYEISNFAKQGYASQHNQMYWKRKPYKAFGLGACSFDGEFRFQNHKQLPVYLKAIEQQADVTDYKEEVSREQKCVEKIMLGIRQTRGVALHELIDDFLPQEKEKFDKELSELKQQGFIIESDGYISLTPKGLSVENAIVLRLTH